MLKSLQNHPLKCVDELLKKSYRKKTFFSCRKIILKKKCWWKLEKMLEFPYFPLIYRVKCWFTKGKHGNSLIFAKFHQLFFFKMIFRQEKIKKNRWDFFKSASTLFKESIPTLTRGFRAISVEIPPYPTFMSLSRRDALPSLIHIWNYGPLHNFEHSNSLLTEKHWIRN